MIPGSIRTKEKGEHYVVDPVAYAWHEVNHTDLPPCLRCETLMELMSKRGATYKRGPKK